MIRLAIDRESIALDEDLIKQGATSLMYLNTICRAIGVTDLHHENDLLITEGMRWVPIDMEVIKPGHATGLFGYHPERQMKLSEDERQLLLRFNLQQSTRLFRNVPIPTVVLIQALTDRNIEMLTSSIKNELVDFNISMADHRLFELINEDMMNNDVPYFSQKERILYYGIKLSSEFIIGDLKTKE